MFVKTPKIIQYLFPSIIWRKENLQNNIWLTFDDGPSPETTPFILKKLKEEKIKATFFLIGKQIERYPELFKKIIDNGHVIANHSYSHQNGWKSNLSNYLNDIEKCQRLMPENKLFRPPYGKLSPLKIWCLKKNYKLILWDIFTWDFHLNSKPKEIKENVLKHTRSGSIIVFHNNKKSLKNLKLILKETITELKEKGFVFSTSW